MHDSIQTAIKKRIIEHGHGWCFTTINFLDLGSDVSVRKALSSLQKQKFIRRLTQGIYDYPNVHEQLGIIPPDLNKVAKAIAEKKRSSNSTSWSSRRKFSWPYNTSSQSNYFSN